MSTEEMVPFGKGPLEEHELYERQAQSNRVLGFWIFLASDCAFFASLFGTYLALGHNTLGGLGPKQLFDLPLTGVMTIILLTSSLTMVFSFLAMEKGDLRTMKIWLWVTALLGLFFLEFQAYEFTHYWASGLHLSTSAFASSFYVLVGFHGLHVAFGVFWLLTLLVYSLKDGITPSNTSKVWIAGLYWHFVDVVWVVIFTVVYIIGKVG